MDDKQYGPMTVVIAEGRRVGFAPCLHCGVPIMSDPDIDTFSIHTSWHLRQVLGGMF